MKEKLEANLPHHTVSIPDHEINWIETGKEIWVNGKMFDIKTSHSKKGVTTFTGLYDENETALKIKLDKDWQKRSSNDGQLLSDFFQTLQGFFFNVDNNEKRNLALVEPLPQSYIVHLCSPYRTVLTPPPQV